MVSPGLAGESSVWSGSLAPPPTGIPTDTTGKPPVRLYKLSPMCQGMEAFQLTPTTWLGNLGELHFIPILLMKRVKLRRIN